MALILVCGLPGTGKTTVAREVASQLDAELLRTDVIRKETFDTITYTDEQMRATYEEMMQRAKDLLQVDKHVVLDATFRKRDHASRHYCHHTDYRVRTSRSRNSPIRDLNPSSGDCRESFRYAAGPGSAATGKQSR